LMTTKKISAREMNKSVKNGQLKKTPSYGRIDIDLKVP